MTLSLLAWLSNPITLMLVMMLVAGGSRVLRNREPRSPDQEARIVRVASGGTEAAAAALMFLTSAYRPSVEFIAKTQIQQQEDADDDDQGGPDSPKKHFDQELRRLRNGEAPDRLMWRLE